MNLPDLTLNDIFSEPTSTAALRSGDKKLLAFVSDPKQLVDTMKFALTPVQNEKQICRQASQLLSTQNKDYHQALISCEPAIHFLDHYFETSHCADCTLASNYTMILQSLLKTTNGSILASLPYFREHLLEKLDIPPYVVLSTTILRGYLQNFATSDGIFSPEPLLKQISDQFSSNPASLILASEALRGLPAGDLQNFLSWVQPLFDAATNQNSTNLSKIRALQALAALKDCPAAAPAVAALAPRFDFDAASNALKAKALEAFPALLPRAMKLLPSFGAAPLLGQAVLKQLAALDPEAIAKFCRECDPTSVIRQSLKDPDPANPFIYSIGQLLNTKMSLHPSTWGEIYSSNIFPHITLINQGYGGEKQTGGRMGKDFEEYLDIDNNPCWCRVEFEPEELVEFAQRNDLWSISI